jgi:glycerol kinase
VADVVEAGVRGAALLAGLAAGVFDRLDELPSPPGGGQQAAPLPGRSA